MTATQAAGVKPQVTAPQAPPPDRMSSARQKSAPNWALKTAMAGTGALLALLLVAGLVVNLWFFMLYRSWRMIVTIGDLQTTQRPLWPTTPMLLSGGLIVLVLIVVHAAIGVVLVLRSRAARGVVPASVLSQIWPYGRGVRWLAWQGGGATRAGRPPSDDNVAQGSRMANPNAQPNLRQCARLQGGLHSMWAKSMPITGAIIGLLTVAYLIWPVRFELTGTVQCTDPGTCATTSLGLALTTSLPTWLAITLYIVALVVVCLHAMHGLNTVATVAAGDGVLLGQITRWMVVICGAVLVLLVVANIVLPLATWMGWF